MDNKFQKQFDIQKISENKKITKNFVQGQIVVMSGTVIKINHVNKRQQRVLVITNKTIYNIGRQSSILKNHIKRKIPFSKIIGLSMSNFGNQMVIHIDKEDDYRFFTPNLKEKFCQAIVIGSYGIVKQPLKTYFYDDLSLEQYTTTVVDIDKKKRKLPKIEPVCLDQSNFQTTVLSMPQSKLVFKKEGIDSSQSFQEFDIIKVLGRGAFGKVMLCKNKKNKQYYAVKSMRKQHIINADCLERSKTQKFLLEKAHHPFLVSLEYAFMTKQKIFFVMKYYGGGQLFSRLKRQKKFSEKRAKFYAAQIFMGINYLHRLGYVYRDLKPENVLIDMNGYIKISDYGLAKHLKPEQLTYSLTGTPSFISIFSLMTGPQILVNEGHSFPTDYWSLGVLVYQMIFGKPPFYDKNQKVMFNKVINFPLQFIESQVKITPQCKSFLKGLLDKYPKNRLGTKDEDQIKNHPWFKDMDWDKLHNFQIKPQFVPEVINKEDVAYFHPLYTEQQPVDSLVVSDMTKINQYEKQFQSFIYERPEESSIQGLSLKFSRQNTEFIADKKFQNVDNIKGTASSTIGVMKKTSGKVGQFNAN